MSACPCSEKLSRAEFLHLSGFLELTRNNTKTKHNIVSAQSKKLNLFFFPFGFDWDPLGLGAWDLGLTIIKSRKQPQNGLHKES